MKTNKNFLIVLIVLLICYSAQATAQTQTKAGPATEATATDDTAQIKIVNGQPVQVAKVATAKAGAVKTLGVWTLKTGAKYPIYKGSKGGYYILRTSKKSGKEYKQYLKQ
jgi:hypothetical protein